MPPKENMIMPTSLNPSKPTLWLRVPSKPRSPHTSETLFRWIETTDDPDLAFARQRLDSLWNQVPQECRSELESRLRSARESDLFSALSEMWYFEQLTASGLSCRPSRSTSSGSRPDWEIFLGEAIAAVVEVYVRLDPEADAQHDRMRRSWFELAFRKLKNQRVRVCIHRMRATGLQPNATRFAAFLDRVAAEGELVASTGHTWMGARTTYCDPSSGWELEITPMLLPVRSNRPSEQLLAYQAGEATWSQGTSLLATALSRKAKQHRSSVPVILCIVWNYFPHEPDIQEVCESVASSRQALQHQGVGAVFWARSVYPWSRQSSPPVLLHWNSEMMSQVLAHWRGTAIDVTTSGQTSM